MATGKGPTLPPFLATSKSPDEAGKKVLVERDFKGFGGATGGRDVGAW